MTGYRAVFYGNAGSEIGESTSGQRPSIGHRQDHHSKRGHGDMYATAVPDGHGGAGQTRNRERQRQEEES